MSVAMSRADYVASDGVGLIAAIRARRVSARSVTEAALAQVATRGAAINAFTTVLAEQARGDADRVDAALAAGGDPGPLAGLPFAVKNLFDVVGITTLAGSKINRDRPPAVRDARAVAALRGAGAVLVGALNMDEYAYGFTGENAHYGPVRNPHDPTRVAGGSSGGSGAAVGSRARPARPGLGHQRLGARSRGPLRCLRIQADLRARVPGGHRALRGQLRSCGGARPLGARRHRRVRRHAGTGSG